MSPQSHFDIAGQPRLLKVRVKQFSILNTKSARRAFVSLKQYTFQIFNNGQRNRGYFKNTDNSINKVFE